VKTMHVETASLLAEIHACCDRHGIGVCTFGGICGDTTLVRDMRKGRRVRQKLAEKIRAAIRDLDSHPPGSSKAERPRVPPKPTSYYEEQTSFTEENRLRRNAREASRRLSRRLETAAAPVPQRRAPLTFEQQLALVESGQARIVERVPLRRPDPAHTMGGVVGDYSI